MSSLFDFDNSQDLVFAAKTAGKQIISAKHEALTKLGAFLFLAHSDNEFALRCQMFDNDITAIANRRLATVSDSKGKLVRALHAEWTMRHASCEMCKVSTPGAYAVAAGGGDGPDDPNKKDKDSIKHPDKIDVDHMQSYREKRNPNNNNDKNKWKYLPNEPQCPACGGPHPYTEPSPKPNIGPHDKKWDKTLPPIDNDKDKIHDYHPHYHPSKDDQYIDRHEASKGDQKDGQDTTTIEASVDDSLKGTSSSSDSPLNEAETISEPNWSKRTKTVESSVDSPATTPPSTIDPGMSAAATEDASTTVAPMNTNSDSESGHNMNSVPSMTAGIKSSALSCNCGEEAISNFNGKPSCLPGMGCQTGAQSGNCPGCGQSFHGFNVCPGGNCQGNPEEEMILKTVMDLKKQLQDLTGNGESLETVMRHDKGHDDWHRSMGQEPCTSEEDCAAKTEEHKAMEHTAGQWGPTPGGDKNCIGMRKGRDKCVNELSQGYSPNRAEYGSSQCKQCQNYDSAHMSSKKKKKEDHYKYIKKQGDSWVITQKGTGKVLSHHDSKEKAIESFKAMMANKHGSKVAHHHDFDDEEEHYSGDSVTGLPLRLVGQDGNAFAILGAAQKALRRAGLHDEHWNNYHTEATSGDYNHLLATTMKYFGVH